MRKLTFFSISLVTLALIIASSDAAACGCGGFKGPVVAHGTSPYGLPWRVKTVHVNLGGGRAKISVESLVGDAMGGSIAELPLPLPSRFVFGAESRGEVDEYPESDISGVTPARVGELRVAMDDGEVLPIKPVPAPPAFRKRFPWLNGLRFFDAFYSQSKEPTLVTALDRNGQIIGRSKSHRVAFLREPVLYFFFYVHRQSRA
jgi:hypothetical protein